MRLGITGMAAAIGLLVGDHGAHGHGGGLNAEGCHYNRKTGDYHCHRGPKPGQGASQHLRSPTPPAARRADPAPAGTSQRPAAERLKDLKALRDQGLITPEQYDQKSAEILRDL